MEEKQFVELPIIEKSGLVVLRDLAKFLGTKPGVLRGRLESQGVKCFRYKRGEYLVNLEQLADKVKGK